MASMKAYPIKEAVKRMKENSLTRDDDIPDTISTIIKLGINAKRSE